MNLLSILMYSGLYNWPYDKVILILNRYAFWLVNVFM